MKAIKIAVVIVAAGTLAACTTNEKTASGAGIGAAVGALASNSVGGAVAGAVIGGVGTYLFERADGRCQYRNSRGKIYTRRCHWK
jgi:NhaP-type Na+/H+ or K+/H+ antiporter